jgi:hypothetical protein
MLANLYLIPHLLGAPIEKLDLRHSFNWEEPDYVHFIPEEYFALWTEAEREWARPASARPRGSWRGLSRFPLKLGR